MKAAATRARSVPHQDGLVGRGDSQLRHCAFVSNSRSLGIAAIGGRSSREERRPPIRAGASHSSASWNGHPGRRSALRPRTPWPTRMTKTSMTGQGSQMAVRSDLRITACPAGRSRGAARRHSRRDGRRSAQRVTKPERASCRISSQSPAPGCAPPPMRQGPARAPARSSSGHPCPRHGACPKG
jgi:hypothetical protein